MKNQVTKFNEQFKNASTLEVIEYLLTQKEYRAALSSSFGREDQVLTDMMLKIDKDANIFTLDTGRLPYETYTVMEATNTKYKIKVDVFFQIVKMYKNFIRHRE